MCDHFSEKPLYVSLRMKSLTNKLKIVRNCEFWRVFDIPYLLAREGTVHPPFRLNPVQLKVSLSAVNDDLGVLPNWNSCSGQHFSFLGFQKKKMEMLTRKGGQKGNHLGAYLGIMPSFWHFRRNVTRASYFHKDYTF